MSVLSVAPISYENSITKKELPLNIFQGEFPIAIKREVSIRIYKDKTAVNDVNLQRREGLSTAARMAPFILTVDWLGWLYYCLVVNTNRNDCCNHFRDPKRIPDANGPEKPAE